MSQRQEIYQGNLRFAILASTYLIYLAFGGIVLSDSEWKGEMRAIEKFHNNKQNFLKKHPTLTSRDLDAFLDEIKAAVEKGVKINGNKTYNPNWNFGGGVLYAASLLTTIGYGDISPYTNRGRLFSMVYAVIGIPMTATLLSAMVSRWMACIELASDYIKKTMWYKGVDSRVAHLLGTLTVIAIASSLSFILPAFIFAKVEEWTYFESLYFSFITMTTVGLGDFVPGCSAKWDDSTTRLIYKVLLTFYFVIGLSFMLLILELSGRVPETTPSLIFSCEARVSRGNGERERSRAESISVQDASDK